MVVDDVRPGQGIEQGVPGEDVVDQFTAAVVDAGVALGGGDQRGEVPQAQAVAGVVAS